MTYDTNDINAFLADFNATLPLSMVGIDALEREGLIERHLDHAGAWEGGYVLTGEGKQATRDAQRIAESKLVRDYALAQQDSREAYMM